MNNAPDHNVLKDAIKDLEEAKEIINVSKSAALQKIDFAIACIKARLETDKK